MNWLLLSLLGGGALVFGALLPWFTHWDSIVQYLWSFAGYEGDGILTGGIGLLLLIGALVSKRKPGKLYSIPTAVLAAIAGSILLHDLFNPPDFLTYPPGSIVSAGPGIYLSITGAILALAGGFQRVHPPPQSAEAPPTQTENPPATIDFAPPPRDRLDLRVVTTTIALLLLLAAIFISQVSSGWSSDPLLHDALSIVVVGAAAGLYVAFQRGSRLVKGLCVGVLIGAAAAILWILFLGIVSAFS